MEVMERLRKTKRRDIAAAELAVQIVAAALLFSDKMFVCKWWDFLDNTHLGARITDSRSLSFFGAAEIRAVFRYGGAVDMLVCLCAGLTAANIILLLLELHSAKTAEILGRKGFAAVPALVFAVFALVLPAANIRERDYYAVREAYRELSANAAFYIELLLLAAETFLAFAKRALGAGTKKTR